MQAACELNSQKIYFKFLDRNETVSQMEDVFLLMKKYNWTSKRSYITAKKGGFKMSKTAMLINPVSVDTLLSFQVMM